MKHQSSGDYHNKESFIIIVCIDIVIVSLMFPQLIINELAIKLQDLAD